MPLKGNGFMVMWHDISAEAEADYHLWHTREHMPERLSIPGFTRGRRGVNWDLGFQRYLTLYEGAELSVFSGADYLERLNHPTPWTQRLAPAFRNFLRVACQTLVSEGLGVGGAVGTYRGRFKAGGDEAAFAEVAAPLAAALRQVAGVTAVHVAVARPDFSEIATTETQLRPKMGLESFDAIVVVEAVGLAELNALDAALSARIAETGGLSDIIAQTYDMAFVLDALPAAAAGGVARASADAEVGA